MGAEEKNTYSIGSTLRERGKKPVSDISDVWMSQTSVAHKKRTNTADLFDLDLSGYKKKFRSTTERIGSTVTSALNGLRASAAKLPLHTLRNNRKIMAVVLSLLAVVLVRSALSGNDNFVQQQASEPAAQESLGASTVDESVPRQDTLQSLRTTDFELLWPSGMNIDNTEVVKVSPPQNDPVYAYISEFSGVELRISQQQIPSDFDGVVSQRVEEVARSFQATDKLQVDEVTVYHGFSDKFGGVQSLIFTKDDLLVFVSSPKSFSEIEWAGYISGLK